MKTVKCFLAILFSLSFIIIIPPGIANDNPSGYYIIQGDSVIWDAPYARLEVFPHTAKEGISQTQYCNFTWKQTNTLVDLAFIFPFQLQGNKDIFLWKNYSHQTSVPVYDNISGNYTLSNIKTYSVIPVAPRVLNFGDVPSLFYYYVSIQNGTRLVNYSIGFDSMQWLFVNHTRAKFFFSYIDFVRYDIVNRSFWDWQSMKQYFTYAYVSNKGHVYYCKNIPVIQSKNYLVKWCYCLPPNCQGKWELLIKLSSDTLQQALDSGHYASIDPWYDVNWGYCKRIEIDHTKVKCTMPGYPMYFVNTSSNFSHAQADGDDFMFIGNANTTKYNHEIEDFTANKLTAWVNITLSPSTNTVLYLYYGNAGCSSQQNRLGTWNRTRYISVYHMKDLTTTTILDSTNVKNGTKQGVGKPLQTTGKVGFSENFTSATHDNITISTAGIPSRNFGSGVITMTMWVRSSSIATTQCSWIMYHREITFGGERGTDIYIIGSKIYGQYRSALGVAKNVVTGVLSGNTWYFINIVRNVSSVIVGYINGGWFVTNNVTGANAVYTNNNREDIGSNVGVGDWSIGNIDEVRLEKVNTNLTMHQTQYNNMNSPSTFFSVGSEIMVPYILVSNVYPVDGSTGQIPRPWLTVTILDSMGYTMNISFFTNISGSWTLIGTNSSVGNGVYKQYDVNLVFANKKTWWRINVSNGHSIYVNNTYSFTTGLCNLSLLKQYTLVNVHGWFNYTYLPLNGFNTWSNWTGNSSAVVLHKYENIHNATGFHNSTVIGSTVYVWANYTGNCSGSTNNSIIFIKHNDIIYALPMLLLGFMFCYLFGRRRKKKL